MIIIVVVRLREYHVLSNAMIGGVYEIYEIIFLVFVFCDDFYE